MCALHHYDKAYEESNHYCQRAEALSQVLSVDSISENVVATLTDDNVISYAGEPYELALLYPIGMTNYLGENNSNEALVDARKLDLYSNSVKSDPEEAFARLLAALIYESEDEPDSAIIDYRRALNLYAGFPEYKSSNLINTIGGKLLKLLSQAGMDEEFHQLKTKYNLTKEKPIEPGFGEIIILFESGFAPYKATEHIRIPESGDTAMIGLYKERPPLLRHIRAKAIGDFDAVDSQVIYDTNDAAHRKRV